MSNHTPYKLCMYLLIDVLISVKPYYQIGHIRHTAELWAMLTHSSECIILTHWGRVTHICVGKLTIIASDNGLSPGRRQAIIWTNAGILLIGPLGTNFSEILIGIQIFSFKKMHLKMSSAKWRPSCLGLNVLKYQLWKFFFQKTLKWHVNNTVLHDEWMFETFLRNICFGCLVSMYPLNWCTRKLHQICYQ